MNVSSGLQWVYSTEPMSYFPMLLLRWITFTNSMVDATWARTMHLPCNHVNVIFFGFCSVTWSFMLKLAGIVHSLFFHTLSLVVKSEWFGVSVNIFQWGKYYFLIISAPQLNLEWKHLVYLSKDIHLQKKFTLQLTERSYQQGDWLRTQLLNRCMTWCNAVLRFVIKAWFINKWLGAR